MDLGDKKMNWDTNETLLQVTNDELYKNVLISHIGKQLLFSYLLTNIIFDINKRVNEEMKIDCAVVDGNEIYNYFCDNYRNEEAVKNEITV